jgi:hypothetical protein
VAQKLPPLINLYHPKLRRRSKKPRNALALQRNNSP